MAGIGEGHIIKAAAELGLTGLKASFSSNSASLVLRDAIKRMPGEELIEILKKEDLAVTKNHVGVPTTKITLGFKTK